MKDGLGPMCSRSFLEIFREGKLGRDRIFVGLAIWQLIISRMRWQLILWNFQCYPSILQRRNWVSNWSCLCTKASIKFQYYEVWRTSGWVTTWRCWEKRALEREKEALYPFPHTLPYTSLSSGCSSVSFLISFYNKLVNSKWAVSRSSVSHSSKWIQLEEGVWELLLYGQLVRSMGDNLDCAWHLRGSCGLNP